MASPWLRTCSAVISIALLTGGLLLGERAEALTLEHRTLHELGRAGGPVVRGVVTAARTQRSSDGARLVTVIELRTLETFSGTAPGERLEVLLPGGTLEGLSQRVAGAPRLEEGREVVLLLTPGTRRAPGAVGRHRLAGSALGALEVVREPGRSAEVRRLHPDGLFVLDRASGEPSNATLSAPLEALGGLLDGRLDEAGFTEAPPESASRVPATAAPSDYVRIESDEAKNPDTFIHWPDGLLELRQNEEGDPRLAPAHPELAATSAAWDTWAAVAEGCPSSLTLVEGALTDARTIGYDSENPDANLNLVVYRDRLCEGLVPPGNPCWDDLSCGNSHECWVDAENVVAVTLSSYERETGRIRDADIEVNAASHVFGVEGVSSEHDVQGTMTHEIGHFLGLDHHPSAASTMYYQTNAGDLSLRTLDAGSQRFVCEVYPPRGCGCSGAPGEAASGLLVLFGLLASRGLRHLRARALRSRAR